MSRTATGATKARARTTVKRAPDYGGKLPQDLADAGWVMKEHAGKDNDRVMCENKRLRQGTALYLMHQEAIEGAYRIQRAAEKNNNPLALKRDGDAPAGRVVAGPTFTRLLKFPLDDAGKVRIADQLVPALNLLAEAEAVKKEAAADEKAKRETVTKLEEMLTTGEEEREGDCQEVFDYGKRTVRTVRCDTQEEIEDPRAMTERELQPSLLTSL